MFRVNRAELESSVEILARLMGTQVAGGGKPGIRLHVANGGYNVFRIYPGGAHRAVFGETRRTARELYDQITFAIQAIHHAQDLQTEREREATQQDAPQLYILSDGQQTTGVPKWMTPDQFDKEQDEADRATAGTWRWVPVSK